MRDLRFGWDEILFVWLFVKCFDLAFRDCLVYFGFTVGVIVDCYLLDVMMFVVFGVV